MRIVRRTILPHHPRLRFRPRLHLCVLPHHARGAAASQPSRSSAVALYVVTEPAPLVDGIEQRHRVAERNTHDWVQYIFVCDVRAISCRVLSLVQSVSCRAVSALSIQRVPQDGRSVDSPPRKLPLKPLERLVRTAVTTHRARRPLPIGAPLFPPPLHDSQLMLFPQHML